MPSGATGNAVLFIAYNPKFKFWNFSLIAVPVQSGCLLFLIHIHEHSLGDQWLPVDPKQPADIQPNKKNRHVSQGGGETEVHRKSNSAGG